MRERKRVDANAQEGEIVELITPIVRFLRAGGIPQKAIEAVVRSEYRRRPQRGRNSRVRRVGINNECARLIANWKVLPSFLDRTGYPRDLRLRGTAGFLQLAKVSAPSVKPMELLNVLHQYGAVTKTRSGKLRLKTKVFLCNAPASGIVAFEPNAQFLTDAARVVDDQLRDSIPHDGPRALYWRTVDNHWVPAKHVREFVAFSKRRTMMLMEEIEDWLDEHEATRASNITSNLRRLGVGIFTISERSQPGRLSGQR